MPTSIRKLDADTPTEVKAAFLPPIIGLDGALAGVASKRVVPSRDLVSLFLDG